MNVIDRQIFVERERGGGFQRALVNTATRATPASDVVFVSSIAIPFGIRIVTGAASLVTTVATTSDRAFAAGNSFASCLFHRYKRANVTPCRRANSAMWVPEILT